MTKYEVVLYWSDEDGVFVTEVPELPGCMAHGATREEAVRMAEAAIDAWIATSRHFGDPVPEPKGRRLLSA